MNVVFDKYKTNDRSLSTLGGKLLLLSVLLIANIQASFAQEQFRSLNGELNLDAGVAQQDLNLRVTVRNHSFVVIPGFTIIRPITSQVSDTVVIAEGASSTSYSISQIIEDPVDYTIQIECLGCKDIIPTQYYAPSGNSFGLPNSVYIDPADLPAVLNVELISRAQIAGEIELAGNMVSKRDLVFTVSAVNADNPAIVYQSINDLVLAQGESSVAYQLTGLSRTVSPGYRVQLQCTNCFGRSAQKQTSSDVLTGGQNHQAINFLVTDIPLIPLAPILQLLL